MGCTFVIVVDWLCWLQFWTLHMAQSIGRITMLFLCRPLYPNRVAANHCLYSVASWVHLIDFLHPSLQTPGIWHIGRPETKILLKLIPDCMTFSFAGSIQLNIRNLISKFVCKIFHECKWSLVCRWANAPGRLINTSILRSIWLFIK